MNSIRNIITTVRLKLFGPRTVASAVASLTKAAQDLQEAAEHHAAKSLTSLANAALHEADSIEAKANEQHALRVKSRIDAIVS